MKGPWRLKGLRITRFSLATLLWIITVMLLCLVIWRENQHKQDALLEIERLKELIYHESTIRVDYDRILLFRLESRLYALLLKAPPKERLDRVDFEWIKIPDASTSGMTDAKDWDNLVANLSPEDRGAGSTDETMGHTFVHVGPFMIPWSRGGPRYGWLYLSQATYSAGTSPSQVDVYREQLDDLRQLKQIDNNLWKPVRVE
jgi:hypothetical protein